MKYVFIYVYSSVFKECMIQRNYNLNFKRKNTMKHNILIASVVGMATASTPVDWYKDPYNELDVTIDGQT